MCQEQEASSLVWVCCFFFCYVLLSVSNFLFFVFFMYKLMKIKLMNLCFRVIMQLKQLMLKQFFKHSLNLSKDFLKAFCISKAEYFRSIQK